MLFKERVYRKIVLVLEDTLRSNETMDSNTVNSNTYDFPEYHFDNGGTRSISVSAVISASCFVVDDTYHNYVTNSHQTVQHPENAISHLQPHHQLYHSDQNRTIDLSVNQENTEFGYEWYNGDNTQSSCGYDSWGDISCQSNNNNQVQNINESYKRPRESDFNCQPVTRDTLIQREFGDSYNIAHENTDQSNICLERDVDVNQGPCSMSCTRTNFTDHRIQEYPPEGCSSNSNYCYSDIGAETEISDGTGYEASQHLSTTVSREQQNEQNIISEANMPVEKFEIDVDHMLSNGVTVAGFKPRPIIRKKRKRHVISDLKTTNYWNRRTKNNDSARKSREAKKEKERMFYKQALQLEYENYFLKERISQLESQLGLVPSQSVPINC